CAKLADELCPGDEVLGAVAGSVRRLMPWLPGPVLHFGKSSKDPEEIARFLLAQINAMVVEPIPFPSASTTSDPAAHFPATAKLVSASDYEGFFGEEADPTRRPWRGPGQDRSLLQVRAGASGPGSPFDQFRRVLYQALEVLVEERGPVVLVVDAIEEITF